MALTSFQYTTNLGAGLCAVYQILRGQALSLQMQVTNRYGGPYALSLRELTAGGFHNPANQLSYTGDPTWTSRSGGSAFTTDVSSTSPSLRTHNLQVGASTPLDFYPVQAQMAGNNSSGDLWSQESPFYIQVLAAAPPVPTLTNPARTNNVFSVRVVTASGFTYYLEYRTNIIQPNWLPASQVAGNGAQQILSDPAATSAQRFYQVRVQ